MVDQVEFNKLKDAVAKIGTGRAVSDSILTRLDAAIERLTDVVADISQILVVHEEKHSQQTKSNHELVHMSERNLAHAEDEYKLIHERISKKEREESERVEKRQDSDHKKHLEHIAIVKKLEDRIISLEKWKYIVMGAAIVIGSLMGNIPWSALF